ncbi:cyanophycin synthetase family protein [Paludibaculum fermentans]|uniref:cyanophycin synthetase family protein n=1 Tax=Paludibaculum fermentans TaxID=1473598 RepID=UPI003EBC5FC2
MRALRGPNQWTNAPVMECWVQLGAWNELSSEILPGFNQRLLQWLPGLVEHRCNIGVRGGFVTRLERGTYPAHVLEHIVIELHGLAGAEIWYGRARHTSQERVYRVVFKYRDETLARECCLAARELFLAAALDLPFDVPATVGRLRNVAARRMLAPDARALVEAAAQRNIPALRPGDGQIVQFGYGARQRRVVGTQTDRLGAIAATVADDRDLLEQQLLAAGVPLELAEVDEAEVQGVEYRLLTVGGRLAVAFDGGRRVVTDEVHPGIAAAAVEVAAALDWDIATLDIRAEDIRSPLQDQKISILKLQPGADLAPLAPDGTTPNPAAHAIIEMLFPSAGDGRIPIVAITGANGKTSVARLLAHMLQATGKCVGMTCTDGVYLNGRRIAGGDCSGPSSAMRVLLDPRAELAVFETARGGILRAGLAFDACQVGVITNIGSGDHLGIGEIESVEDLAKLKSTIIRAVSPEGTAVLNADDPVVAGMASQCRGRVLYFALDAAHAVIARHRSEGGLAVFVRDGFAVVADGALEWPVLRVDRVPLTLGGRVGFQIENLLAAIGAAYALGVPPESIERQAEDFTPDLEHNPARYNVLEIRGTTVVLDFGHNPDALNAAIRGLAQFGQTHRTAVFSSSGDRRDEDIVRMGELLGASFDRVILYEDDDLYDRGTGEVIALLRRGMATAGRARRIEEVQGGLNALDYALKTIEAGHLLFAQAHMADPTAGFLRRQWLG